MAKPIAKPQVVISVLLSLKLSGNSSSITTYIIAPAAKDNKYGKALDIAPAANNVSPPATGSTTPDITP